MNGKPLTKSLHTVTAAVNIAGYLATTTHRGSPAATLANASLGLLGYGCEWNEADPTFAMVCKQLRKLGLAGPEQH